MARFFRRIRNTLIAQGRIGNYFLYATGEIVLVVVGILIALQINTWNEGWDARKLENVYYCKILEDVRLDKALLSSLTNENEERIMASNEAIAQLQRKSPPRREVNMAIRASIAKTTFTFKPSKSAFEDLKSSGNLSILRDLEVKDLVINYYSIIEGYVDLVDVNSDAAVAMNYHVEKDFVEIGWQELDFVRKAIDSTKVDIKALESQTYQSPQTIKKLLSESVFYLYTNARKRDLYAEMAVQIGEIERVLVTKCK